MEYKTDKRTKNLTLRDIHIGDWVQIWSTCAERYSPPAKVTAIFDTGDLLLLHGNEMTTPTEEVIDNIDALPIDEITLKGFGFDVSDKAIDRGDECQDVSYHGKYIGQVRYMEDDCDPVMILCGYQCIYIHELIAYLIRNKYEIYLEWKGV